MSLENLILNTVDGIAGADYLLLGRVLIIISLIFWLVVTSWIWVDSEDRTTNTLVRVFYVLIGIIPILGWIIYLIIRPTETIEEIYWGDLERRYLKYEAKDLGDCSSCGAQIYPGFIYCPHCNNQIKQQCSQCEVYVDIDYKFCFNCGNRMKRNVKKEEIPTNENMQKQIDETKEEVHTTVREKRSKYKKQRDFIAKIWASIIEGYKLLGQKIGKLFNKREKENENNEGKKKVNEKVVDKSKKNKKKRKKKKKRK